MEGFFLQTVSLVLQGISLLCSFWLTGLFLYHLVLTFFGFGKAKKDYADHDPQSRFLVLVPAHNEERVIGDIIDNLQHMDYPEELVDFFIIADNCDDDTAGVARRMGAKVIETRRLSPDEPTGKPVALKKALARIGDYAGKYDLLMVFDADNLIDRNMFREVNSQFLDKGRPDLIQCYLGSKNNQGVVPWFYYMTFTVNNRFVQLAKHRLGLNAAIGGTGFAVTTSYLKARGGWTSMSLTEDHEIQVDAILSGRRVLWNHFTRVYDEKPTRMSAAIRQQIRWGQGRWYVFLHQFRPAFRSLFAGKISFSEFLSVFTCMASMTTVAVSALQILTSLLLMIPAFRQGQLSSFVPSLPGLVWSLLIFGYSYLGLFYAANWQDNGIPFRLKTLPLMMAGLVVTVVVNFYNQGVGLLRCHHQQHWDKTEHFVTRASTQAGVVAQPRRVA